jgi:hypothetical protein
VSSGRYGDGHARGSPGLHHRRGNDERDGRRGRRAGLLDLSRSVAWKGRGTRRFARWVGTTRRFVRSAARRRAGREPRALAGLQWVRMPHGLRRREPVRVARDASGGRLRCAAALSSKRARRTRAEALLSLTCVAGTEAARKPELIPIQITGVAVLGTTCGLLRAGVARTPANTRPANRSTVGPRRG